VIGPLVGRGVAPYLRSMTTSSDHKPGWVATLAPDNPHRDYWERALTAGFDPSFETISTHDKTAWVLRSARFEHITEALEVREIAEVIIAQLNGAQAALGDLDPLKLHGVGKVDYDGSFSTIVFGELTICAKAHMAIGSVEVRDSLGNLVPPPPPRASLTQSWIQAARTDDDIADLLRYAGHSDNWYDIYKAMELLCRLAGGKNKLSSMLGDSAGAVEHMRETANIYRHARPHRTLVPTTLCAAKPLLAFAIRTVLAKRVPPS